MLYICISMLTQSRTKTSNSRKQGSKLRKVKRVTQEMTLLISKNSKYLEWRGIQWYNCDSLTRVIFYLNIHSNQYMYKIKRWLIRIKYKFSMVTQYLGYFVAKWIESCVVPHVVKTGDLNYTLNWIGNGLINFRSQIFFSWSCW